MLAGFLELVTAGDKSFPKKVMIRREADYYRHGGIMQYVLPHLGLVLQ